MSVNNCVLIFGRSLNLAGLAACLKADNNLDIHVVDHHEQNSGCVFDDLKPETIIYDLNDPPRELDLALLGNRRGILLIGVDPCSDDVLVFKGQRSRVVSASELSQLISTQIDVSTVKRKHKE